jgi:hypothetical protein
MKRWLPWLPPALLVFVALIQITLTQRADLDPWKGGGFGMFSSLDRIASRQLRASMLAGSQWVPFRVPRSSTFDMRRATSMPTDAALDHFAELMIALDPPEHIRAIRVEVLKLVGNAETREFGFSLINARTVELVDESS